MGLWVAKHAADAGLKVTLIDGRECGSGASGGILGALLPYLPNAMTPQKRFQLQALDELPKCIDELERETGISTQYGRCGRILPLRHDSFHALAKLCAAESLVNWAGQSEPYQFELIDTKQFEGWINTNEAPLGLAWDNLSAKITPRAYIKALKASLEGNATILEGFRVSRESISTHIANRKIVSNDGTAVVTFDKIVLAAGYQTFDLLTALTGCEFGRGIKGHSAVFEVEASGHSPIIYDDGVYIVPHQNNRCALGSTSEPDWTGEHDTQPDKAERFIARAKTLCPKLQTAKLLGLWAGVRPKTHHKDPIIGCLYPESNVFIASGGFKTSFGIAHRLARHLVDELLGSQQSVDLPESYRVEQHVAHAKLRGRLPGAWPPASI